MDPAPAMVAAAPLAPAPSVAAADPDPLVPPQSLQVQASGCFACDDPSSEWSNQHGFRMEAFVVEGAQQFVPMESS